jgi:hypothetical protein
MTFLSINTGAYVVTLAMKSHLPGKFLKKTQRLWIFEKITHFQNHCTSNMSVFCTTTFQHYNFDNEEGHSNACHSMQIWILKSIGEVLTLPLMIYLCSMLVLRISYLEPVSWVSPSSQDYVSSAIESVKQEFPFSLVFCVHSLSITCMLFTALGRHWGPVITNSDRIGQPWTREKINGTQIFGGFTVW